MNPEIKAEWIERLTNGERKQGEHYLKTKNGRYCCLGVLSEMAAEAGVVTETLEDGESHYRFDRDFAALGEKVLNWAGLPDGSGLGYINPGLSLSYLNDTGTPFSEIAKIIEEEL